MYNNTYYTYLFYTKKLLDLGTVYNFIVVYIDNIITYNLHNGV